MLKTDTAQLKNISLHHLNVELTEGAEKGIKEIVEDATGKDAEDLTEEEKAEVLAEQGKELTKEEKALKVADGLAALSEGMGGRYERYNVSWRNGRTYWSQPSSFYKSWYG